MILPDANLLLYAYSAESPSQREAGEWWEACLSGTEAVGVPWMVILAFIRILTNPRVRISASPVKAAVEVVRSWMLRPHVQILHPGDRHASILFSLLEDLGVAGNLTMDAHLAALAIEYQAVLHSSDADFSRFSGLRWTNPLRKKK